MARAMDKWYTDKDGNNGYVVAHYVGGEEGNYVYNWFDTEQKAEAKAKELNSQGITYGFNCCEGECTIHINWEV